MDYHYHLTIYKAGKIIDEFPDCYNLEIDSCITVNYIKDEDIECMVSYSLSELTFELEFLGEY